MIEILGGNAPDYAETTRHAAETAEGRVCVAVCSIKNRNCLLKENPVKCRASSDFCWMPDYQRLKLGFFATLSKRLHYSKIGIITTFG
ncbi:MAG: hypothetical protein RR313_10895 [Anaerovoracaceae bacterium]